MLVILGSGDYARDVQDVAAALGFETVLVGPGDDARWMDRPDAQLALGIGTPTAKEAVVRKYGTDRNWVSLIHPMAFVSPSAKVGRGVTVTALGAVCANAELSDWSTVTWSASVGHGAKVGRFSTLFPCATMGGDSRLGGTVMLGAGARLYPRRAVGERARVGMGAVVLEDMAPGAMMLPPGALD